jgi:hypothetical protein
LFGWYAHTEAPEKKRLMTLSEQKTAVDELCYISCMAFKYVRIEGLEMCVLYICMLIC